MTLMTVQFCLDSDDICVNFVNCSNKNITLKSEQEIGSCESYEDQNSETQSDIVRSISSENENQSTKSTELPDYLTDLFERSSIHLNEQENADLKGLLIEFKDVFAKSSGDLGRCDRVQHRINTGNAAPVRQPVRRQPIARREVEREEIRKMLEKGVIEPSNSPWSSPIVLVQKANGGGIRFCLDYRVLNDLTKKDAYPLPRTDELLENLANSKWYSTMDLNSGFWQVGMAPEDREKTAFATSLGLFQWTVMPFGLANSPSTWERLMEDVLRGLQWVELFLYMDDIISPSNNIEQGLQRLRNIFTRLRDANLKLKPSKCCFFQKQAKFLGHVVSEKGISTDPTKVDAIKSWPVPRSVKQLRSFLGLSSYYRRFCQGYAHTARPLHKLCEKGVKFAWSEDAQKAFDELKEALTNPPVLAYPIPGDFIIDSDASDKATGAILSQLQNGEERVIAYLSKALSKHEQSYCTTRKELLAVVRALKTFHPYVYGQKVLVRTDNAAVSWVRQLKHPTGQIARWIQELETYDLTVVHRPGLKHTNADAMSRKPCKVCERQERLSQEYIEDNDDQCYSVSTVDLSTLVDAESTAEVRVTNAGPDQRTYLLGWTPADVRQEQSSDPDISVLLTALESQSPRPLWEEVSHGTSTLKTLWRQWDRLKLVDGTLQCLFLDIENNLDQYLLVVPASKRQELMQYFHDIPSGGHMGSEKTLSRLRQTFYWPGMKEDVVKFCGSCDKCTSRKSSMATRAPLKQALAGGPMEKIALDVLGPLPLSKKGSRFILVVVDCFTKWTEAYAIPNQESSTIASTLVNEFIGRFGTPLQILSDQGLNFTSAFFKDVFDLLKIDKIQTNSMRPQANGNVERFNRTLQNMLTMYCS